MLKLGVIGTHWITAQFIRAAQSTGQFKLTAVYSRKLETAQKFGETFEQPLQYFEQLDAFMQDPNVDVVYIASPNALHFAQAKLAINADKHVLVEKPAFTNPTEMRTIQALLQAHPNVYYFEAARQIYEPNFQQVTRAVQTFDHQDGAVLTYMKYSSRFDAVLAGKVPNIFSPKFAGGALQDLGVYLVYDALSWFGVPESVQYHPVIMKTGVDANGIATLQYPGFQVTLITGKNVQSSLPSEIYSGKQTLRIDNAGEFNQVTLTKDLSSAPIVLSSKPADNPMSHEAQAFADMINGHDRQRFQELNQLSIAVNQVLFQLRQSAGLIFPADEQKG